MTPTLRRPAPSGSAAHGCSRTPPAAAAASPPAGGSGRRGRGCRRTCGRCSGRAWPYAPALADHCTSLLEWQTRVVMRYSNGNVRTARKVHRRPHKVHALLGVGGLHHGKLGRPGIVPVILLVLGGMHGRIVGRDNDEAAVHAVVGGGENRVGRYVDAHVLHGRRLRTPPRAAPIGHLHRHLFVGGPLAVEASSDTGAGFQRFPCWACRDTRSTP